MIIILILLIFFLCKYGKKKYIKHNKNIYNDYFVIGNSLSTHSMPLIGVYI